MFRGLFKIWAKELAEYQGSIRLHNIRFRETAKII